MAQASRGLRAACLLCVALFDHAFALAASPGEALREVETQLVDLYRKNKDAVVRVKVATKSANDKGDEKVSLTVLSGFFIDADGTVVTNAIPTDKSARIWVERDGRQHLAIAMGSDRRSNLGVLKTVKPPDPIRPIALHPSSVPVPIGSIAFAITSPLELAPTPKWGLVAGRESQFSEIVFPFTYLRISVASGPAEGGSPVFDREGNLIGVSVATLPEVDSSYIVPTPALLRIVEQLRLGREFSYADIHARFSLQPLPSTDSRRLVVTEVEKGSPTEAAGLKVGDALVAANDMPVESLDELRDIVFFSERGSFLQLTIERAGETKDFAILVE